MIGRIVGSVIGAYWDKADLDESAGSDILEFRRQPVPGASRRTDSPVAIAAVNRSTTDIFWIDTANQVATAIPR